VPQLFLDDLRVYVLGKQERGAGVPEVVEPDYGWPGSLQVRRRQAGCVAARLLHNGLGQYWPHFLFRKFYLQNSEFSEWTRGDSNP
jgi:hypothetical protein